MDSETRSCAGGIMATGMNTDSGEVAWFREENFQFSFFPPIYEIEFASTVGTPVCVIHCGNNSIWPNLQIVKSWLWPLS